MMKRPATHWPYGAWLLLLTLLHTAHAQFWGNFSIATRSILDPNACTKVAFVLNTAAGFSPASISSSCTITNNPYPGNEQVKSLLQIQYLFANYNSYKLMWLYLGASSVTTIPGGLTSIQQSTLIWTTLLSYLSLGCDTEGRYKDNLGLVQGSSTTQPVTTYACSNPGYQQTRLLDPGSSCDYNINVPCQPPPPFVMSPYPPSPNPPSPSPNSLLIKFTTSSPSGFICSNLIKAVNSVLTEYFTSLSPAGANWLIQQPTCTFSEAISNTWTVGVIISGAPLAENTTGYLLSAEGLPKLVKAASITCSTAQINLLILPDIFVSASCSNAYPALCCPAKKPKASKSPPPLVDSPPPTA